MQRLRRALDQDPQGAGLWAGSYRTVDELRQAVAAFVELYNREWLIERLGHRTPRETYLQWLADTERAA